MGLGDGGDADDEFRLAGGLGETTALLQPTGFQGYVNRGMARLGQVTPAIEDYDEAIRLSAGFISRTSIGATPAEPWAGKTKPSLGPEILPAVSRKWKWLGNRLRNSGGIVQLI